MFNNAAKLGTLIWSIKDQIVALNGDFGAWFSHVFFGHEHTSGDFAFAQCHRSFFK